MEAPLYSPLLVAGWGRALLWLKDLLLTPPGWPKSLEAIRLPPWPLPHPCQLISFA